MSTRSIHAAAIATLILSTVAMPLTAPTASAASKIEMLVNDRAITTYDIDRRARLLQLITRKGGSHTRNLAREELIDEALKLEEADKRGFSVSQSQVDGAFASIAQSARLSPDQLASILSRSGAGTETLKNRLRAQIAWASMIRSRFQAQVQIDEQEVVRALRQKEEGTTPAVSLQYDLYQVIFVIPDKSAQSYRAKQRGAAKSLRSRFRDCGTDLASLRGQRDIVVKRIGIRNEADMRTEQREMLSKTDIGRLTEAREEQNGIEMIAVCDKKELQSDATARSIVEEELRDKETQLLERRYLRELRRNAVIIKK